jgi:SHS2 domain-containing protein
MVYRYLEDFATADIAFEARGATLEEVFKAAAEATLNVMIEELETVLPRERREAGLQNEAVDMLLFEFLQEIIYQKDAHQLLLRARDVQIRESRDGFELKAVLEGEVLDPNRHSQRVDVKAVTLHHFLVEPEGEGWLARVILDI